MLDGHSLLVAGVGSQDVEYLASSAEHLALVGDEAGYRDFVARADAVAAEIDYAEPVEIARAAYDALHGDAAAGLERLARLDTSRAVVASGRPRRLLLTAVAHQRLGDLEAARRMARSALDAAAAMGVPDLHHRMHRPVLERLEPLLVEGGVSAADLTATRLQILGGFRLVVGGEDRTPQPGHPTTLVKVLALRSTVTVDGAIDLLWPDADLAVGRTRLRNTLHRLKDRSGSIVVRDGETLRLAAGVAVDAGATRWRCTPVTSYRATCTRTGRRCRGSGCSDASCRWPTSWPTTPSLGATSTRPPACSTSASPPSRWPRAER